MKKPLPYIILWFALLTFIAFFTACTTSRKYKPGHVYLSKSQQRMGKTNLFTGEYVKFKR